MLKNIRELKTAEIRRSALEKETKTKLTHIGSFSLNEELASLRNIENMIGAAQVPIGVAGPLKVNGSSFEDEFFIPLATTEGALVASVNRGCKAITESGGANSLAHRVGMTRGPVFYTGSVRESDKFYRWIKANENKMAQASEKTSSHLKLKKIEVRTQGIYAFVRFYFDTSDAMGMNMVTLATEEIARLIEKETGVRCLSVAGNFDIDKKPAWINFISNRGFKVWSDVVLKKEVIEGILKTSAEKFFEVWLAKCMIGSAMSGSLGFNAQFANIIAAAFIATGQDPAHVVEGSLGMTTAKLIGNGDLLVSVYLPSLNIGTVGGGTELNTQSEALNILGVKGSGNATKFAEIIGGAVLAGEISLLSSLSEGSLGKAHQKLARSK